MESSPKNCRRTLALCPLDINQRSVSKWLKPRKRESLGTWSSSLLPSILNCLLKSTWAHLPSVDCPPPLLRVPEKTRCPSVENLHVWMAPDPWCLLLMRLPSVSTPDSIWDTVSMLLPIRSSLKSPWVANSMEHKAPGRASPESVLAGQRRTLETWEMKPMGEQREPEQIGTISEAISSHLAVLTLCSRICPPSSPRHYCQPSFLWADSMYSLNKMDSKDRDSQFINDATFYSSTQKAFK